MLCVSPVKLIKTLFNHQQLIWGHIGVPLVLALGANVIDGDTFCVFLLLSDHPPSSFPPDGLHPSAPGSSAGPHWYCHPVVETRSPSQWDNFGETPLGIPYAVIISSAPAHLLLWGNQNLYEHHEQTDLTKCPFASDNVNLNLHILNGDILYSNTSFMVGPVGLTCFFSLKLRCLIHLWWL